MFIIQQLYCLNLQLDTLNHIYYMNDNRLKDKKIVSIRIYTGDEDITHSQPYSDHYLSSTDDFIDYDLFVNLTNHQGKTDYLHKDIINHSIYHPKAIPHLINEYINTDKSYIKIEGTNENTVNFPLYVFCQNKKLYRNIDYTHIKTYHITSDPETEKSIPLDQIVGKQMEGKKIVRIVATEINSYPKGYLNIIGKDNRTIEMLPLAFCQTNPTHAYAIEPIDIDWENSTLHKYTGQHLTLTFFYQ